MVLCGLCGCAALWRLDACLMMTPFAVDSRRLEGYRQAKSSPRRVRCLRKTQFNEGGP